MNSIQDLIGLQKIDTHLEEIEELLGNLPRKVAALKSEEKTLTSDFEQGKERLKEIKVELHKAEVNVTGYKEKIEKLKDQLFLVTNNKQYDALMHEIDSLKEKLDQNETKELELLEEKDQLSEQVQNQEKSLGSISKDLGSQSVKLEKAIAESDSEKSELKKRKAEKTKDISINILARYKKIFSAKDSLAGVSLEGRACGGCGAVLPPQLVTEVKTLSIIINCSICGRFLFWDKPK